tara:strand:+ start:1423 stop:1875 length:453 start_codon:yes stop_codon:yes gene_type:complete
MESVRNQINRLKKLGQRLVSMNYPLGSPNDEPVLNPLKHCDTVIDGYRVTVHYNKADYGNHFMETFQVLGRDMPFLPFNAVCKLATLALGDNQLSLVELYKDQRKIYCWTLMTTKDGEPIKYPYEEDEIEYLNYQGFDYVYMNPNQVKFY